MSLAMYTVLMNTVPNEYTYWTKLSLTSIMFLVTPCGRGMPTAADEAERAAVHRIARDELHRDKDRQNHRERERRERLWLYTTYRIVH